MSRSKSSLLFGLSLSILLCLSSCIEEPKIDVYNFEIVFKNDTTSGKMRLEKKSDKLELILSSIDFNTVTGQNTLISDNQLTSDIGIWGEVYKLEGTLNNDSFKGGFSRNENTYPFSATLLSNDIIKIDRSKTPYLLAKTDLSADERNIDHASFINDWNNNSFQRGGRIYNSNCINCHGNPDIEGSIPLSTKFWEEPLKAGSDPYSMYETITRGFGSMPPQINLTPSEKYDVIHFIQEAFVRTQNSENYFISTPGYIAGLPKGNNKGPETKPYHPWSDMDYGNFFINTYELVDSKTGPERYHSPGPSPFPDEDYSNNNFAYKGIAVRLDEGPGGVSKGRAWMMFDHDLMRVAGAWTGNGFIDWNAILLNDRHETYPRTVGKLHFETPVGPAWANPFTGKFEDPRFTARDGRQFGPLPKKWANYKGLFHYKDQVIVSYSVGESEILEKFGMASLNGDTLFTRTLNFSSSNTKLKSRIAPLSSRVSAIGEGFSLSKEDGFHVLTIEEDKAVNVKLFIASKDCDNFNTIVDKSPLIEQLSLFTRGGPPHYPEKIKSDITTGRDKGPFAIDVLTPPFQNPWKARMKLSGIDFLKDGNVAVACATDGDIWKITGLTDGSNQLQWQRIGSGLFQPLGIKVIEEQIYVTCRDQLVRLNDLNGDGETDFYEAFNHDHQVTDHFHEFAMGLQADDSGNLYYAKSGRHAREALIPQHGTLMKVSADGSKSEIVATGFRAANGVCINPDGSFIVTDQQGYWNPMNRINWVDVGKSPKFYGNMWGYNPPKDSSRNGMEQPMVWVDIEFDRSPSELLWVDSDEWGPLNGSLLSFSYGYGKIQLVLNETVKGQRQGGVIDMPGIKFLTGVMRGRFNPEDGQLYACGMSAWGTSQLMWGGGLYRIRYTGKTLPIPIQSRFLNTGLELTFDPILDKATAENIKNFEVEVWELKRSKKYGSDRYNRRFLNITDALLLRDNKTVRLAVDKMTPIDVLTISYKLKDTKSNPLEGKLQSTIHALGQRKPI